MNTLKERLLLKYSTEKKIKINFFFKVVYALKSQKVKEICDSLETVPKHQKPVDISQSKLRIAGVCMRLAHIKNL